MCGSCCRNFRYLCAISKPFHAKAMSKPLYNLVSKDLLKEQLAQEQITRKTISFYQYAHIVDAHAFRDELYSLLDEQQVYGRVYVSDEGVNAQISVPNANVDKLRASLDTISFLRGIRLNMAREDDGKSFYKLKIKVKEKIVADGLDDSSFDVTDKGTHVDAETFNKLADDPNTVIVDMRNHYESEVGHFKGAITPDVETFREELPVVEDLLADQKDKNILLYWVGE